MQAAVKKAGPLEAIRTGYARLGGMPINLGVMDFSFMGGSMGSVVGEKIARLARRSLDRDAPLIIVSASGGARMQEGVLSLMQMAKTSVVVAELADRGIPFVSILTNPTTGGVSASYAMQGDVILVEPGAVVGFAGPRVIKQTIGQDLPEGFQTAEFLLDHGMIDAVVPRSELRETTAQLLRHMAGRAPAEAGD
jgi:acetyl-CoA carboxylase carboxyl transferase subunit beta